MANRLRQPLQPDPEMYDEIVYLYRSGVPKHDIEKYLARAKIGSYRQIRSFLDMLDANSEFYRERKGEQRMVNLLGKTKAGYYPQWKIDHYKGYVYHFLYDTGTLYTSRNKEEFETWLANMQMYCHL